MGYTRWMLRINYEPSPFSIRWIYNSPVGKLFALSSISPIRASLDSRGFGFTMEVILVSLHVMRFEMQRLRRTVKEQMCRILEELRHSKMETVIVENHPVEMEKLVEESRIQVIMAHKKVTNLRV